jgi:5-methylcytosine-specific restriction endonuclease McrA
MEPAIMADEDYTKLPRSRQEAISCGSQFFFTGVPCKNGHISKRYVKGSTCQACAVDRASRWQKANPKRHAVFVKNWDKSHPEVRDQINVRFRAVHREKLAANMAKRREADPEIFRRRCRDHYAANREEMIQRSIAYAKANPDKINAIVNARRAREVGAEGRYTEEDVIRILETQNFLCVGCGDDITTRYTVDHITPLIRGGSNWPDNLQCMCRSCNASKNTLTMDEWLGRVAIEGLVRVKASALDWATNDVEEKRLHPDTELPEGWRWGRLARRKAA